MPKLLKTPFAVDAAEGFRTDIQESTGAAPNSATYQVGFPPVTMQSIASNGMPPKGSDLNGVLYDITDNLVFLTQGGGYGFDSAYATSIGGYPLNARLRLTNGDIVKSTVDGNTNDPNTDMTGWVNVSDDILTTPSIAELRNFKFVKDGRLVRVVSHRTGINLGGGLFKWDAENTQTDNNFNVIAVSGIATGRFIRLLNGSTASIEDAGGLSGEDVSGAVNTLLTENIKTITGQVGASYIVNQVILNKEIRFFGDFTITKPNKDARMFNLHTGKYTIEWDGVTFDGKYDGGSVEGGIDIEVTTYTAKGLTVNFKNCKNNNISKILFYTGYPTDGDIKAVNIINCGGNGNHLYRATSEDRYIYGIHGTNLTIDNYNEIGDGIYDISGLIINRMPMPVLFCTYSKVKIKNPVLKDAGGFVLYKNCDGAVMENPNIDNCVYPFRVQQSANTFCIGGSITNTPYEDGAIKWQPYARLDSSIARKELLTGLVVDGTYFKGNLRDIVPTGAHLWSGLYDVADCRATGIKINAIFAGAKTCFVFAQDASYDMRGSSFYFDPDQTSAIYHLQSAVNGAGVIDLTNTHWDGSARSLKTGGLESDSDNQIIVYSALTTGAVQQDTQIILKGSILHNMKAVSQALFYYRKAGRIVIEDNDWTGVKPKLLAIIRDNDYVTVKDNRGFTYPMNSTNGGNVNFADVATLKFIDVDTSKQSAYSPSLMYTGNGSVPTYTTLALGSVAKIYNPIAGGATEYVLTTSGWKPSSTSSA